MSESEAPQDGNQSTKPPRIDGVWDHFLKDAVIVGTGSFLLINEALSGLERPTIIAAAIGCFGLPFAIRADERRRSK